MKVEVEDLEIFLADSHLLLYKEGIRELLTKVLPKDFFSLKVDSRKAFLLRYLPKLLYLSPSSSGLLPIIILTKHRPNISNFFYDIISHWLVPQKCLKIETFFSADFALYEEQLTIVELVVDVKEENFAEIFANVERLESDIKIGAISEEHANKILEFKGLSTEKKVALIQEKMTMLIKTHKFEHNIYAHMQQFLFSCREEFKASRDYNHISHIISILYILRKVLKQKVETFPGKRFSLVKVIRARVKEKNLFGVLLGINLIHEHEVFEKMHLFGAIKGCCKNLSIVENSLFIDRNGRSPIVTCYVEIEGAIEEIQKLKNDLPSSLKSHIGYLMHPLFIPRNEEDVVRNVMALSNQLRYLKDIPQINISFDQQMGEELHFTVVLLRILGSKSLPMQQIFNNNTLSVKLIVDRVKKVGFVRREYAKEATIFKAILTKEYYLREDESIDLAKARQSVLFAIGELFGEVRDFNGGMILKQTESFNQLKMLLDESGWKGDERFLEQFFYSIQPIEMSVISKHEFLKVLFLMLLNAIKREEIKNPAGVESLLFKQEASAIFVVIPLHDLAKRREITDKVEDLALFSAQLASSYIRHDGFFYLNYIFFSEDSVQQKSFLKVIQEALTKGR